MRGLVPNLIELHGPYGDRATLVGFAGRDPQLA